MQVKEVFSRVGTPTASKPSPEEGGGGAAAGGATALKHGLLLFLRTSFGPWLAEQVGKAWHVTCLHGRQ